MLRCALTSVVIRRHGLVPTVDDLRPVLVPVQPVRHIVRAAGLLFGAAGADAAGAVARAGLDADGGVEGEADDGDVEGGAVGEVETPLPGEVRIGYDL